MLWSGCVRASLRGFISFYLDYGSLALKYVSSADSLSQCWNEKFTVIKLSNHFGLRFKKKLAYSETIRVDSFDNGTLLIRR